MGAAYRVVDGKHRLHRLMTTHVAYRNGNGAMHEVLGSFIVFTHTELALAKALVLVPNICLG